MNDIITPTMALSLTVKDAAEALAFYTKAFGAEELFRLADLSGAIAHAEFRIGNSHIYISGESAEWSATANPEGSMASCLFSLTVDNCDNAFEKAVQAGAKKITEPVDQFWGMRTGVVLDPYGYRWNLRHVVEEVSNEEMAKRAQALFGA